MSIVKEGDKVVRGQRIAEKPEGALGAHIYSSVCGTVTAVDENQIVIEE